MEEFNVPTPAHLFKEALTPKSVRGAAGQKQGDADVVTTPLVDAGSSHNAAAGPWWTMPLRECLHELFERQAVLTPDAPALLSGAERLTYRELNARADQLAHFLRGRGVGADTPVGVCAERSAEMVVAILGVLKAGGGYVPLDPEYPRERISLMLADSGVTLLLTQQHLLDRLPPHAAEVLRLDADWDEVAQSPETGVRVAATPENLAYIIYTSGSTGRPKGVMVTHRALGNHMLWMQRRFPLGPDDRVVQKTPFSFDASVWELFAPLIVGARLVLAAPGGQQEPAYLVDFMNEQGVTALKVVPSLLERLLDEEGFGRCRSLRYVFCGAEAMPLKLAERFFGRTGARLFNLYGPTEAAIDVTFWPCEPGHGRRSIPIGKPIINTQVYVLDERMRLAPMGVAGELYVGGESLARGYWRRPDLTAEKFVPNPYSKTPSARLYRTGDVVRWNDERELEYLGRNDAQVKVRGFRIELGEVETALLEREEVARAVVLVREEEGRSRQLAAYVTAADGSEPNGRELRGHLEGRLPEYMVPASITVVERMPLMPNGKVDRKALLAIKVDGAARERELEGARNEVEELLASVWRDVLGVEQVGIHDNFFELGGDSILSIQIATRAKQLGLHVRVRQLFQHRTIAELAGAIQQAGAAVPAGTAKAERDEAVGELPLTPIQRRFFEHRLPNPHHYNQSVMLAADDDADPDTLRAVVAKLVEHHDALRLRFTEADGGWRQSYADSETHELVTFVDLSHLSGDEQRRRLEEQAASAQASLDITEGPLLRAVLFDMGEGRGSRLLLAVHHLSVDGVSWRILLEDLQSAFSRARAGQSIELPARTSSFKRWAEGLQRYAASEELRAEAGYWLDDRRSQVAALPVDFAGGENTIGTARSVEVTLSREETQALLQEVPRAYHTQVQEVLAAGLALAMKGWTGESGLLVDMEGHGREEVVEGADVSRTVGWFTSLYPVLLEVSGEEVSSALKGVKEQLRGVPGRGIGYGVLRYLSEDEAVRARLRETPAAEVSFNYLGQFDQVLGGEFRAAAESMGATQSHGNRRTHLLAVSGMVADGRLRVNLGYSEALHRRETVERVAEGFASALRELIARCGAAKQEQAARGEIQNALAGQWGVGTPDPGESLLVEIKAGGSRPPLFCVSSYTDDPAFMFGDLAQQLGDEQPLYGLWVPDDELFSYERLAARHVAEMRKVRPAGPYLLGGFSLGGVVAFEIARQLRASNEEVALLVLFETVCPTIHLDLDAFDDAELAERIVRGHDPGFTVPEHVRGLGVGERLAYILERIKAAYDIPADKDVAEFGKFLSLWRRRSDYTPEPYAGEMLLFRTRDNSILNEHLLDAEAYRNNPADQLGWNLVARGAVEVFRAPGEHSNFILAPHAAHVGRCLREHIGSLLQRRER